MGTVDINKTLKTMTTTEREILLCMVGKKRKSFREAKGGVLDPKLPDFLGADG